MAKPTKQPVVLLPEDADPIMKATIRHFIGLLICDQEIITTLPHAITTETHLPISMQAVEGQILNAIYVCHDLSQPPTKENVIHLLQSSKVIPEPEKIVEDILKESDVRQPRNVALLAHTIDVYINEVKLEKITEMIPSIRREATLDYSKKFQRVMDLMIQAAPNERSWELYTEDQMREAFLRANRKLVANRKKGVDLGPELPFEYAKKTFGYMEWGELTTIMAQTGFGKTTMAIHIAEHAAWKQKLNCDAHIFIPETSVEVISRRQVSKHMLIPYQTLKNGEIDFDDPQWKPKWEAYEEEQRKKNNNSGYINMVACPGANSLWIVSKMRELARASHALGRSSLFIIDYLQRLNWQDERLEKYQAFEAMGDRFSNEVRTLHNNGIQCHLILFAQEGDTEGEAFGSKFIRKISQIVMRIQREKAEGGVKNPQAYPSKDGKLVKDALGNPRYLCNVGDEYTHQGSLDISKANDSAPTRIQLWFEGKMSNIMQDPYQLKIPKELAINPGKPKTEPINPAPNVKDSTDDGRWLETF